MELIVPRFFSVVLLCGTVECVIFAELLVTFFLLYVLYKSIPNE